MDITIMRAEMSRNREDGYRGIVVLQAAGHKQGYEVTLLSKNGKMWDYSLSFEKESGPEQEIEAVEMALEQDDELFDQLIDAAMSNCAEQERPS